MPALLIELMLVQSSHKPAMQSNTTAQDQAQGQVMVSSSSQTGQASRSPLEQLASFLTPEVVSKMKVLALLVDSPLFKNKESFSGNKDFATSPTHSGTRREPSTAEGSAAVTLVEISAASNEQVQGRKGKAPKTASSKPKRQRQRKNAPGALVIYEKGEE